MWRSRQKKAPQGKKSRKPAKPTKRLKPETINRELACLEHLYNRNAVLALGIAFEALLSETNPSPVRVLGERFAFLAPKSTERSARYKLFTQEYYAARSSIAHGARK